MKDFYQILGVSKDASNEEIKKAYRKLAHQHHPDKGGDENKFKEINEAYQTLSNSEKRTQYDQFGRTFDNNAGNNAGFDNSWAWRGSEENFDFDNLGDIFGDFFGFGRSSSSSSDLKKGKDIEVEMELSLESILKSQIKEFSLSKYIQCSRCQGTGAEPGTKIKECFTCRGTGQVQKIVRTPVGSFTTKSVCPECGGEGFRPEKACNVCKGTGRIKDQENIKVSIPAGVDTNQIIKVIGKGEAGRKKGGSGDLYIRIIIKKHPLFQREGDDLYLTKNVSFSQVALGDEIEIPTLESKSILLKIPSGVESEKVFRISGKGIPHFSGYGKGNFYVKIKTRTPNKLSKKQKELFEQLKGEGL